MLGHAGLGLAMMESDFLAGTGTAIAAGESTTITGITTATTIIVSATVSATETTTVTSEGRATFHKAKHIIFGPAATATYCLPLSSKVIGDAFIRTFVSNRQSVFPSR
jgi:hypothetical protein